MSEKGILDQLSIAHGVDVEGLVARLTTNDHNGEQKNIIAISQRWTKVVVTELGDIFLAYFGRPCKKFSEVKLQIHFHNQTYIIDINNRGKPIKIYVFHMF